jgi:hypothetical protein
MLGCESQKVPVPIHEIPKATRIIGNNENLTVHGLFSSIVQVHHV